MFGFKRKTALDAFRGSGVQAPACFIPRSELRGSDYKRLMKRGFQPTCADCMCFGVCPVVGAWSGKPLITL